MEELLSKITSLYNDVKKAYDKEQRKQQQLRRTINILSTQNETLEKSKKSLTTSIASKDDTISKLQSQIEQQKKQIGTIQAEINSLKLRSRANRPRQSPPYPLQPGSTNQRNVCDRLPIVNKPFVSNMTWHQRNQLKIGDKIDYRCVFVFPL